MLVGLAWLIYALVVPVIVRPAYIARDFIAHHTDPPSWGPSLSSIESCRSTPLPSPDTEGKQSEPISHFDRLVAAGGIPGGVPPTDTFALLALLPAD